MTISTYAELKTALAEHMHRTDDADFVARAGDFILMGESRINRELRILDMIQTQSGTLDTTAATLALPTRYAEKISFRINDPLRELQYVTPSELKEYEVDRSGQPYSYTVTDTFEFDCISDAAYSYTLKYYQGYKLTDDSDTNYILANYPQLYLYAAVMHAAIYTRDMDLGQQMSAVVANEIKSCKRAERTRKGFAEAVLTTDLYRSSRYNINRD
jgi:hypothetical protein